MLSRKKLLLSTALILTLSTFSTGFNYSYKNVKAAKITNVFADSASTSFKKSASTISAEDAKGLFLKYGTPQLTYVRSWKDNGDRKLKLVYALVNGPYYYIDFSGISAKNGRPVGADGKETAIEIKSMGSGKSPSDTVLDKQKSPADAATALKKTEEFLKKLNINADDSNLQSKAQSDSWYGISQKNYSFNFKVDGDKGACNVKAVFNAENLSVEEINSSFIYKSTDGEGNVSYSKAVQIAQKYVSEKFPDFVDNLIMVNTKSANSQKGYNISFWRTVNGAAYPENNINITVDADTGNISSVCFRWEYISFPDTAGTITSKAAADIMFSKIGLVLDQSGNGDGVYELSKSNAAYIDAFNGKLKNSDGSDAEVNKK